MLDYWNSDEKVLKFQNKNEFFKSEKFLLNLIKNKFKSVIDIGCASGMTAKLLAKSTRDLDYVGIDIAPKNIESAITNSKFINLKSKNFYEGNIFEIKDKLQKADLIYGTGFFQHQLDFMKCLNIFVELSLKYIIFDFKIIKNYNEDYYSTQIKLGKSNVSIPFIALTEKTFRSYILKFKNIKVKECIAYKTKVFEAIDNSNKFDIFSSGVLLELKNNSNQENFDIKWI